VVRMKGPTATSLLALLLLLTVLPAMTTGERQPDHRTRPDPEPQAPRQEPFAKRPFRPFHGDRWIGNAVAYGPHRDGQIPGGPSPSKAEIREDLRLMSPHWGLLRVYGSVGPAESLLAVIRDDSLDMKVMLGIWIAPEEKPLEAGGAPQALPEARRANRQEIESAVRLAKTYRDIILAVSVGNETQVFWSDHRVPLPRLIGFVREVRSRIRQPVTVADDFNFWNKPESQALAREVDFIVTHIHPLWNGILLEKALDWTWSTLEAIESHHPGHTIVLGETGWATRKHNEGEQARLIQGQPGEEPQARFYAALRDRADRERVTVFFFEAFDENWKGGPHPNEVEKHWGLFRADRTPKKAMTHEH